MSNALLHYSGGVGNIFDCNRLYEPVGGVRGKENAGDMGTIKFLAFLAAFGS